MPPGRPKKTPDELKDSQKQRRDSGLDVIRYKLNNETLKDFAEMGRAYAATSMAIDLGMSPGAYKNRRENPSLFRGGEIELMATIIGVETEILEKFINTQKKNFKNKVSKNA